MSKYVKVTYAPKWTKGKWRIISDPCHYDSLTTIVDENYTDKHPNCYPIAQCQTEEYAKLLISAPDLMDYAWDELKRLSLLHKASVELIEDKSDVSLTFLKENWDIIKEWAGPRALILSNSLKIEEYEK